MKRVALIQSQQPSGKPPAFHLLGLWGATQKLPLSHLSEMGKKKKKSTERVLKLSRTSFCQMSENRSLESWSSLWWAEFGAFFFPSSSLNKMIPYDSQCDQPWLCLFRSWVGNRTRHAAVCCVSWSWRGGLPVSHGDPKLPRPGGLSLQARILLLNCKAWMSTPSC